MGNAQTKKTIIILLKKAHTRALAAGRSARQNGWQGEHSDRVDTRRSFLSAHSYQLGSMLDPSKYTGCCARQVDEFVRQVVRPILAKYESRLAGTSQLLL